MKLLMRKIGLELMLMLVVALWILLPSQVKAQPAEGLNRIVACLPSDYLGDGTTLYKDETDPAGSFYEWSCPRTAANGDRDWFVQSWVVLSTAQSSFSPRGVVQSILGEPNKLQAVNRLLAAAAVEPQTDEDKANFQRLHAAALIHGGARKPVMTYGGTWKVSANGTFKTRSWYNYNPSTKTFGSKQSGAVVGTPCWPALGSAQLNENGNITYLFAYGSTQAKASLTRVTQCTRDPT